MAAYSVDIWTALGDPTRRAIFEHLAESPKAVGALARTVLVSQPAVSQHLRVLKDAGLVEDRPLGNQRIYQLNHAGLAAHRAQLDSFWTKAMAAYKAIAEPSTKTTTRSRPESSPQLEQPTSYTTSWDLTSNTGGAPTSQTLRCAHLRIERTWLWR